ncbi:MAG: hypothetical protein GY817_07125 [bacterium]|nr:hypothetical protein [bacterium]
MKKNQWFILIFLLLIIGCGEQYIPTSPVLPQHIKKIAILKFESGSAPSEFVEKLKIATADRFVTDRRVAVVNMADADAILKGKISRYLLSPLKYSHAKIATQYQLWVWIDISLYDAVTKKVLWTETRLESKTKYFTDSYDMFAPTTETEAQNIVIEMLARASVKRTIDGWFIASGVSDRL